MQIGEAVDYIPEFDDQPKVGKAVDYIPEFEEEAKPTERKLERPSAPVATFRPSNEYEAIASAFDENSGIGKGVSSLASGLGAGLYDLPAFAGQTIRGGKIGENKSLDEYISKAKAFAEENNANPPEYVKEEPYRSLYEGARSFPTSQAIGLAGAATGAAGGALVGGPVGGVIGGVAGAAGSSYPIMYRQAKDEFLSDVTDKAIKNGATDEELKTIRAAAEDDAFWNGVYEAGPEAASQVVDFAVMKMPVGKFLKPIIKNGFTRMAAQLTGKAAGVAMSEVPSEAYTAYKQTELGNKYGLTDQEPAEAAKASVGPTLVMSALGGVAGQRLFREKEAPKPAIENTPEENQDIIAAKASELNKSEESFIENAGLGGVSPAARIRELMAQGMTIGDAARKASLEAQESAKNAQTESTVPIDFNEPQEPLNITGTNAPAELDINQTEPVENQPPNDNTGAFSEPTSDDQSPVDPQPIPDEKAAELGLKEPTEVVPSIEPKKPKSEEGIDSLTGLAGNNRTREVVKQHMEAGDKPILFFDTDNFKDINDTYGHDDGDSVLETLGAMVREIFPEAHSEGRAGRYGGEEFAVVLNDESDIAKAEQLLKRVPEDIKVNGIPVTISGGIAWGSKKTQKGGTRLTADEAAYRAKSAGRNRLVIENRDGSSYTIEGNPVGEKEYVTESDLRRMEEGARRLLESSIALTPEYRNSLKRTLQDIKRIRDARRAGNVQGPAGNSKKQEVAQNGVTKSEPVAPQVPVNPTETPDKIGDKKPFTKAQLKSKKLPELLDLYRQQGNTAEHDTAKNTVSLNGEPAIKAVDARKRLISVLTGEASKGITVKVGKAADSKIVSEDELSSAIMKAGGLQYDGVDPQLKDIFNDKRINNGKGRLFGLRLIRKNGGLSLDQMAERLAGHGYLTTNEDGTGWDIKELVKLLEKSISGEPQYSKRKSLSVTATEEEEIAAAQVAHYQELEDLANETGYRPEDLIEAARDYEQESLDALAEKEAASIEQEDIDEIYGLVKKDLDSWAAEDNKASYDENGIAENPQSKSAPKPAKLLTTQQEVPDTRLKGKGPDKAGDIKSIKNAAPTPTPAPSTPEAESPASGASETTPGRAYIKESTKPVLSATLITKGKDKGKYRIEYPDRDATGKKVVKTAVVAGTKEGAKLSSPDKRGNWYGDYITVMPSTDAVKLNELEGKEGGKGTATDTGVRSGGAEKKVAVSEPKGEKGILQQDTTGTNKKLVSGKKTNENSGELKDGETVQKESAKTDYQKREGTSDNGLGRINVENGVLRSDYVSSQEVDEGINKFLLSGEGNDIIIRVQAKTVPERAIQRIAKAFAVEVVFFDIAKNAEKIPNGFTRQGAGRKIFINKDLAGHPIIQVFGHELIHNIKNNDPKLYKFLSDGIISYANKQSPNYLAAKMRAGYSNIGAVHDFIADMGGDYMLKPEFWYHLTDKSPTLGRRIIRLAQSLIERFFKKANGIGVEQYISDTKKVRNILVKALSEYSKGVQSASTTDSNIDFQLRDAIDAVSSYGTNEGFTNFVKSWLGEQVDAAKSYAQGREQAKEDPITTLDKLIGLPRSLAKKFPVLGKLLDRYSEQEHERNQILHEALRDPKSDKDNPKPMSFMRLSDKDRMGLYKVILESTRRNNGVGKLFDYETLKSKGMNDEQIQAYYDVHEVMQNLLQKRIDAFEHSMMLPYADKPYAEQLKATLKRDVGFNKRFLEVLDNIHEGDRDKFLSDIVRLGNALKTGNKEMIEQYLDQLDANAKSDRQKYYAEQLRKHVAKIRKTNDLSVGDPKLSKLIEKVSEEDRAAFIQDVSDMAESKNQLQKYRDEMGKVQYYFPLDHGSGDWVVRIVRMEEQEEGEPKREVLFSYRLKNSTAAALFIQRLKKQIKTNPELAELKDGIIEEPKREPGTSEQLYQEVNDESLYRFVSEAIDKSNDNKLDGATRKAILKAMADQLKARGWGRHMIQRKYPNLLGPEMSDPLDVFTGYVSGAAGFISKQKAAQDYMRIMKDIKPEQTNSRNYAQTWVKDILRNQSELERVAGSLRGAAFYYYLAGTLKAPIVNMTQLHATLIPEIGKTVGHGKAYKAVYGAMVDAAKHAANPKTGAISQKERDFLADAIDAGEDDAQFVRDALADSKQKGTIKFFRKAVEKTAIPFAMSEKLLRRTALLAMYRAQKQKGASEEVARKKAQDYNLDVNFQYGKANLPEMARGGQAHNIAIRLLMTFKQYPMSYIGLQKNNLKEGEYAAFAHSMASLALLGGIGAIPFLDDIEDWLERTYGWRIREKQRKALRNIGGEWLARMGDAGLPALAGIDLGPSLTTGLPFTDTGAQGAWGVAGVYGKTAKNVWDALNLAMRGEFYRSVETVAPVAIKNPMKAGREWKSGISSPTGRVSFDPKTDKPVKLSGTGALAQAFSFAPYEKSKFYADKRQLDNMQAAYKSQRDDIYDMYRLGNRREADRARSDYNREIRREKLDGIVPEITDLTLSRMGKPAAKDKKLKAYRQRFVD